jgi:hypothetical protein
MSENKEAVVVRRPGDDVVELSKNLAGMLDLAGAFHQSGMFPNLPSKFAALASVEAGRELGIPPIMALQTIYPIKGRLTIESKAGRRDVQDHQANGRSRGDHLVEAWTWRSRDVHLHDSGSDEGGIGREG